MSLPLEQLTFTQPAPELFDSLAQECARIIAQEAHSGRSEINAFSQVRQFYDEICDWDTRLRAHPETFAQQLPFIRMLNAKASYAEARGHLGPQFVKLLQTGLQQLDPQQVMSYFNFKLFMEAFLGFYKLESARAKAAKQEMRRR